MEKISKGILGQKAGMTQIFTKDGKTLPITVVEVLPNKVLQIKTKDKDSYDALQLGYLQKKDQRATKAEIGHAKKVDAKPFYFVKEIKGMTGFSLGDEIKADIFKQGEIVDVTGISKGKGFTGSIKRHNYAIGPKSHGSKYHRGSGSMGSISGSVKSSKLLPGRMGHATTTQQNLQIVKIDIENNAILVKGSIPGANKSFVVIKSSIKQPNVLREIKLVNIKEEQAKIKLLEEGKKVGAKLNSDMTIHQMNDEIAIATEKHEKDIEEFKKNLEIAKDLNIDVKGMKNEDLVKAISKAKELIAKREAEAKEEAPKEETKTNEQQIKDASQTPSQQNEENENKKDDKTLGENKKEKEE